MSGHGENEAWKEAAEAEDRNFRPTKGQPRRKAPFYKVSITLNYAHEPYLNSMAGYARHADRCGCIQIREDTGCHFILALACSFRSLYKSQLELEERTDLLLE